MHGFFTGGTRNGLSPVFIFLQLKMQGSLLQQAERKEKPSTLIPDVDNAAVGNTLALIQEDTTKGILLLYFWERRKGNPPVWRTEGERPAFCISAMGSRVPA